MNSASPSGPWPRAARALADLAGRRPRALAALTALVLWLAAFALYLPTAGYDYVYYDDVRILADHPELYNQPRFLDGLKAIVLDQFPREEPLLVRDISWAIDSRIFGFPNPHGFHYGNVVLHACNVALLFVFLLALTRRYAVALLTAGCFLSLAIHVEPVAWVMGRKDLLAAAFGFLTLLAHCRGLDAPTRARRLLWSAASLVLLALALLSKIGTVVLPGVLFLLAVFRPALRDPAAARGPFPWQRVGPALLGVLPHLVLSLLVTRWYYAILARYGIFGDSYQAGPLQHLGNLLLINPMVLVRYLQLVFVPADLALFYTWPGLALPATPLQVAASGLVLLLTAAGVAFLLAKRRDLAFYGMAFLLLMVPFLNIKFIGIWVANRYLYFPSFCLLAILVTLVCNGVGRHPRALGPPLAALLLAFGAWNGYQQRHHLAAWRDSETLWTHELSRPGAPPEVYYNLAAYHYTTATRHADPRRREEGLRKAEAVTARARAACITPSGELQSRLYGVLFVDALIAIVRNAPAEQQLAALEAVERLNPTYEAVLWQLVVHHCGAALAAADPVAREASARRAVGYYARMLKARYRDAGSDARDRAFRRSLLHDFPFLKPDLEALP